MKKLLVILAICFVSVCLLFVGCQSTSVDTSKNDTESVDTTGNGSTISTNEPANKAETTAKGNGVLPTETTSTQATQKNDQTEKATVSQTEKTPDTTADDKASSSDDSTTKPSGTQCTTSIFDSEIELPDNLW